MEKNLYQSFVEKINLHNTEFVNNQEECVKFIKDFIKHLSVYINCPDDRIVWLKISEGLQETIASDPKHYAFYYIEKLALYKTGYFKFFIRIHFGPKNGSFDSIQLPFLIKKSDKGFSICDERKEITNNAADHLDDISKYIVANILELIDFRYKFDNLSREKNPFGFIQDQS